MKRLLNGLIVILITTSLFGCAGMTKQDMGTITGAAAGGLLGSTIGGGTGKMLAIGVGAIAGAAIGNAIGKSMDETDRMKMNMAFENNAVGQPAYWHNERTGASYKVVPTRNVTVDGNGYCREYRSTANIGGQRQQIYGTACRQPDGSWKVVN